MTAIGRSTLWAKNRMRAMDKLPKDARGSFIWTLLSGKALEVVEHLPAEKYQCEGGEDVIFELLDKRWPEIDKSAEMGENITKVFQLRASEGETLHHWGARAAECFDSCSRKNGVKFPDEAKGWILLNCGGLGPEQRGVILARAQGSLKFDDVFQAMRFCFPDFTVPKRRAAAVSLIEDQAEDHFDLASSAQDNPSDPGAGDEVVFEEDEVAEVLASTWKERRQEWSKLQKNRRFQQASDVKRSFRVEVEELKRRARCRKCGRIGHWQKECAAKGPSSASSSNVPSTAHKGSAAGYVASTNEEHFICMANTELTMAEKLMQVRQALPQALKCCWSQVRVLQSWTVDAGKQL
eukprot:s1396_g11.t1